MTDYSFSLKDDKRQEKFNKALQFLDGKEVEEKKEDKTLDEMVCILLTAKSHVGNHSLPCFVSFSPDRGGSQIKRESRADGASCAGS